MSQKATIHRISDRSEIISLLKQNSVVSDVPESILIGSRAAREFLPNIRDKEAFLDFDIICSSKHLLRYLSIVEYEIDTIEMIIPSFNEEQLDYYVTFTLQNGEKFDFAVPRSITSYTTFLLKNIKTWTYTKFRCYKLNGCPYRYASAKLLIILKKYLLYYPYRWQKTANDYRQLLTITSPLTSKDKELGDLFIRYNEKLHGPRPIDADEFTVQSQNDEEKLVIKRNEFLQFEKEEQVACIYQAAKQLSIGGDILIGLEHICTKSPPWLSDFVIEYFMNIKNEKFNSVFEKLPSSNIECEISNYRLFEDLSDLIQEKILLYITDPLDFYSMKLVCKRWYTIMHQPSFWQNLYTTRYGHALPNGIVNWKLAYLMKLIYREVTDTNKFNRLVDATFNLARITANDVVHLWEDLTHKNQSVDPDILLQIDYILSHSYYYHLKEDKHYPPFTYSAQLILVGFEHPKSQTKISVYLSDMDDSSSYVTDNQIDLTVQFDEDTSDNQIISFDGPTLFGLSPGGWGFSYTRKNEGCLKNTPSSVFPRFPEGLLHCLFSIMVHPNHRAQFISYLENIESSCLGRLSDR